MITENEETCIPCFKWNQKAIFTNTLIVIYVMQIPALYLYIFGIIEPLPIYLYIIWGMAICKHYQWFRENWYYFRKRRNLKWFSDKIK